MRRQLCAATVGVFAALSVSLANAATLDTVKQRGQLICGAHQGLAGFSIPNEQGKWAGFDVDYCRALAAAVLGDADKTKFVPLSAKDRFTALQSSEIDVLPRNTTWTLTRETGGFLFAATNYYDGQGFMVKKSLGVKSTKELDGATVCVQQGTSHELNLSDYFRSIGKPYQILTVATIGEAQNAYESGRCDTFTTDASGLYGVRLALKNPDEHVVLPEIISKEPLGIAVRQGDDQWFNVVKWVYYALVQAEESGVTQANVDEMLKSDKPDIKRLLGTEGDFGKQLGLDNQWAYRVIKQVGNYGEVFDRNLGSKSPLKIERGLNALWTNKGLQYSPPIR
ncbi:amino acid ABC transporter substrate-binding protein [Labrys okinawensis]|uniref:Amino acid ABC transporter substrate-binding protein n=1 Tax=Labrys okinawensis TaxID=346911 RepID=A0A2S9QB71_9HYPH|nr:amino acid ABC transporter substrate-binding protein [Labrys okinawensis]PRH86603.1 amino acid ABC transporter substrate-binding protein [Labrys okinawensis]